MTVKLVFEMDVVIAPIAGPLCQPIQLVIHSYLFLALLGLVELKYVWVWLAADYTDLLGVLGWPEVKNSSEWLVLFEAEIYFQLIDNHFFPA